MKKIQKQEKFACDKPIIDRYFDEQTLFFDIETTGFTATSANLYLIGCSYRKGSTLYINQFFADTPDEEGLILAEFLTFASNFDKLISFNGIMFDVPFLLGKCKQYHLEESLAEFPHLDLYKEASKLKFLLKLENYKQKTIETFLGLKRDDKFSGGELISVYEEYVIHPNEEALSLLLLHNYEDVLGMYELLPILSYASIFSGEYQIKDIILQSFITFDKEEKKEVIVSLDLTHEVPTQISCKKGEFYLSVQGNIAKLRIPIFEEELRFFHEDYKNYYYLPKEDMAIHKSVAEYVEKEFREKAKANNCYTRKKGIFMPQFASIMQPEFRKEKKDKVSYFEYKEDLIQSENITSYIDNLLSYLTKK